MWTRVNRRTTFARIVASSLLCANASIGLAQPGVNLMGLLCEWQYPKSKFNGEVLEA